MDKYTNGTATIKVGGHVTIDGVTYASVSAAWLVEHGFTKVEAPAAYVPTEEETARNEKTARIAELKRLLADSDYEAIKFAEGEMSEEDYAPYRLQRRAWREEINSLEAELNVAPIAEEEYESEE